MDESKNVDQLDVVIVGAGFSGMYMLHRLREHGLKTVVLESGSDVGGTWYWNRYPGARCDVPSMEYSYSFSSELQQEWDWSEVMAGQPEILEYAGHVADRFSLRSDIRFDTRVKSAHYDEKNHCWSIGTDSNKKYQSRYCIMATGCLSVTNTPEIPGAEDFSGPIYHTGQWPHEGVDFSDVSVGIIGTGSSGIQAIPVIAEKAKHLTIFQRTPNYTMPAHNKPLTQDFIEEARGNYDQIRAEQRASLAGIVGYGFGFGGADLVEPTEELKKTTPEQRKKLVDEQGFGSFRTFMDVGIDPEANEMACEMYRQHLATIIDDPKTATGLMPRDYPIGCKRPVIDTDYYKTFNKGNVTLVDLREGGIERITKNGVATGQGQYDLDAIVYATGFDAMTGALERIDIRGTNGKTISEEWHAGPRTYLGLQLHGFPNLFTITGPGSPSVLSNMMVSIEQHVDWITECIDYLDANQVRAIEPQEQAVDDWIAHVNEVAKGSMFTAPSCNSWYLGANIPGKPRIFMPYVGGVGEYRKRCETIASEGYSGFTLSK